MSPQIDPKPPDVSVNIGAVQREDLAELAAAANYMWHQAYDPLLPAGQVDYMLASRMAPEALGQYLGAADRWCEVARNGQGDVVGYTTTRQYYRHRLRLEQIYVARPLWGSGLADRLLRCAVEHAREVSATTIDLTVNRGNDRALSFYQRRGFGIAARMCKLIGGGYVMDDLVLAVATTQLEDAIGP